MNTKQYALVGVALVSLVACHGKSDISQPAASATAPVALTDEALDRAPVPVKEDYEAKAQQTINSANLDEQLNQLEKQIQSDK